MIDFPPPLPPPLVAQNNKVDEARHEKRDHKIEAPLIDSPLSLLRDSLQPSHQEST